jgi:colicin import membrane protein
VHVALIVLLVYGVRETRPPGRSKWAAPFRRRRSNPRHRRIRAQTRTKKRTGTAGSQARAEGKEKPARQPALTEVEPKPRRSRQEQRTYKQRTQQLEARRKTDEVERELKALATAQAASASSRAVISWKQKVSAKIKANIVRPPNLTGNPEVEFEIVLLPDGYLLGEPKLIKSSGIPALDQAIERAIKKSMPLPKSEDGSIPDRNPRLRFRPLEE